MPSDPWTAAVAGQRSMRSRGGSRRARRSGPAGEPRPSRRARLGRREGDRRLGHAARGPQRRALGRGGGLAVEAHGRASPPAGPSSASRQPSARRLEVEHPHAPVGLPRLEGASGARLDGEPARPADLDRSRPRPSSATTAPPPSRGSARAPRPRRRPRPAPRRATAGRTSSERRRASRGSSRSERRPGPCSIATSRRASPTAQPAHPRALPLRRQLRREAGPAAPGRRAPSRARP